MLATGAGAASRHSIGTGVFAGMLFATTIGIFFIPLFFRVIRGLAEGRALAGEEQRAGRSGGGARMMRRSSAWSRRSAGDGVCRRTEVRAETRPSLDRSASAPIG